MLSLKLTTVSNQEKNYAGGKLHGETITYNLEGKIIKKEHREHLSSIDVEKLEVLRDDKPECFVK